MDVLTQYYNERRAFRATCCRPARLAARCCCSCTRFSTPATCIYLQTYCRVGHTHLLSYQVCPIFVFSPHNCCKPVILFESELNKNSGGARVGLRYDTRRLATELPVYYFHKITKRLPQGYPKVTPRLPHGYHKVTKGTTRLPRLP